MRFETPVGAFAVEGPPPFRVEYPYGRPGDSFRRLNSGGKATCVAYHRGVDPRSLVGVVEHGNALRYGPGDERWDVKAEAMRRRGFVGGDGERIVVHVTPERTFMAEGNHRFEIALAVGAPDVEIEVRYYGDVDETRHLIPFDPSDPGLRVID